MPKIDQQICIVIQKEHVNGTALGCPEWDQKRIDNSYGLVRDPERSEEVYKKDPPGEGWKLSEDKLRAYDTRDRIDYRKHLDRLRLASPAFPAKGRASLVIGNGNLLSNLGIVGWKDGRFLRVAGEDRRSSTGWWYSCFYATTKGRTGIARFSFQTNPPQPVGDLVLENDEALAWVTSGQPMLWDGVVASLEDLIAETYDVRHIYRLPTTVGDPSQRKRAKEVVGHFTRVWVEQMGEPFEHATRALHAFAVERRLVVESRYFMGALGVDDDGRVYIVQRHGSTSEVGRTLRELGATRGILLDQGAGVGTFYLSPEHCENGDFIFRARDLRPERLCVIAFDVLDKWNDA